MRRITAATTIPAITPGDMVLRVDTEAPCAEPALVEIIGGESEALDSLIDVTLSRNESERHYRSVAIERTHIGIRVRSWLDND
jgi:hypothetical protein